MSRQIKTPEEHLAAVLFRRGNRDLFLTDSGQVLLKALRDALPQIESMG
jgi:DNA-binding transcriptional LysR family regulator